MATDEVQVEAGMCLHLLYYHASAQLLSALLSTCRNLILDVRLSCLDQAVTGDGGATCWLLLKW